MLGGKLYICHHLSDPHFVDAANHGSRGSPILQFNTEIRKNGSLILYFSLAYNNNLIYLGNLVILGNRGIRVRLNL